MTVLLGLLAAASAGTSDFLGGLDSRKAAAVAVTTASQLTGLIVALALGGAFRGDLLASDIAWGAAGGLGGAMGLLSIYTGYARARVSIAAPLAGVGAAALPVIADALTGGDDLSSLRVTGICLGLVAIALVSMGKSEHQGAVSMSLLYGLGGAIGLGLLLLCLSRTSDDGGLWPLAAARGGGFIALLVAMLAMGLPLAFPRPARWHVVAIGLLGTGANAFFIAATRVGSTAVAAVLTSMFPAVTVLWAWAVFRERFRPVQLAGLIVALVAVALIAAG